MLGQSENDKAHQNQTPKRGESHRVMTEMLDDEEPGISLRKKKQGKRILNTRKLNTLCSVQNKVNLNVTFTAGI